MSRAQSLIEAAAAQNAQLIQTLSETDYARAALEQTSSYIATLKDETAKEERHLRDATRAVGKEFKEHKSYRDSHMRRLAYKIGGKQAKFQAEASKEEREWLEAVQEEIQSKQTLEHLRAKLASATTSAAELKAVVEVHDTAQAELDSLYSSIFDGPTHEFPGEDEKESAVNTSRAKFNDIQLKLSKETQARSILKDAENYLQRTVAALDSAHSAATWDVWGGGQWADWEKATSLQQAQSHIAHVEMAINEAARIQPLVRGIGNLNVPEMHFMTDVVFDNIFSDMNMRDRITDAQIAVAQSMQALLRELRAADQRILGVEAELSWAQGELEQRRLELQRFRAGFFKGLAAGNHPMAATSSATTLRGSVAVTGLAGQERAPVYDEAPPEYSA